MEGDTALAKKMYDTCTSAGKRSDTLPSHPLLSEQQDSKSRNAANKHKGHGLQSSIENYSKLKTNNNPARPAIKLAGDFFLCCEDLGRMFDHSFPAGAFFCSSGD